MKQAQFKALARNSDGDIIDLYDVFYLLSPKQIEQLTGDDQSRVDDYEEEMRYLYAEAAEEFGYLIRPGA